MDSEIPSAPVVEKSSTAVETSPKSSLPCKKNQKKVPKRIHKAEREKLKRDNLNELFLGLANALELSEQMNGKASTLNEAARFVKDMLSQIKHLRKENTALLSESQYLSMEKKELHDENSALEAQISKLEDEVKENLGLKLAPTEFQQPNLASQIASNYMGQPPSEYACKQLQIMNPFCVFPMTSAPQVYPVPDSAMPVAMPTSNVRKPQARYPTPADVWPSQILENRPKLGQEVQNSL